MLTDLIRSIIESVKSIINSKSNIRASIINKEVEVPENAKLSEMSGYIDQILNEGIDTSDATATEDKLLDGETAYVNDEKIVGGMPNNGSVTLTASIDNSPNIPEGYHDGTGKAQVEAQEKEVSPVLTVQEVVPDSGKVLSKVKVGAMTEGELSMNDISVSSSGVISATAKVSEAGYFVSGKSVSKTITLPSLGGKTIRPSTSNILAAQNGIYTTGDIYVEGDSDLIASNIKSGVSIFGVTGSFVGARIANLGIKTLDSNLGAVVSLDTNNLIALYYCTADSISLDKNDGVSSSIPNAGFLDIINKIFIYTIVDEYDGISTIYDTNPYLLIGSNTIEFGNRNNWWDLSDTRVFVIAIYSE